MLDVAARGGARDAHGHTGPGTVIQQLRHARAQRQPAGAHDRPVVLILKAVGGGGQPFALPWLHGCRGLALHVMQQALAPAGHREQLAVARLAPSPGHPECLKCLVEGDQVPVTLGLRERPVNVPQQRCDHPRLQAPVTQSRHRTLSSAGSSPSVSMKASQASVRGSLPSLYP